MLKAKKILGNKTIVSFTKMINEVGVGWFFLLKLQTAVSNLLKISTAKTSHYSNNRFPPLVKGNAPRELNN